jgi:hypothetical protein
VDKARQRERDGDVASELFVNFADDGGAGIFARFDFPTGKLPFKRQMLMRRSLRNEDTSVMLNHGADNWNRRRHVFLNKESRECATFLMLPGSFAMKTAFKIILIVAILLIAIKLSPIVFVLAMSGLLVAALLGALGLSLLAGFAILVFVLTAALSPIWLPVLAIVGLVALFKKLNEPSKTTKLVA